MKTARQNFAQLAREFRSRTLTPKTTTRQVRGVDIHSVVLEMLDMSMWFEVIPLPDNVFEVTTKTESRARR